MAKVDGKKGKFRIISLDGGGIRGIMTAMWLDRLEKELNGRVRDHCEIIAGTSTGSILACALAKGVPASKIVGLYRDNGQDVFPAPASRLWDRMGRAFSQGISAPKYSDGGLKRELQKHLDTTLLGELPQKPLLLVPAYNTFTRQAVVIKNSTPRYRQLPLWSVAKASSSAPTFFPAHVIDVDGEDQPLIDGGVVANNPTACAIAEGIRVNYEAKTGVGLNDFIVGSFGTGHSTRRISIREAQEWGAVEWAVPVIDVLMDGAADATDYITGFLIPDGQYHRFQTPLDRAYDDMDRADQTNISALIGLANDYLHNQGGDKKIKELAAQLKAAA